MKQAHFLFQRTARTSPGENGDYHAADLMLSAIFETNHSQSWQTRKCEIANVYGHFVMIAQEIKTAQKAVV
jgi:hypothetical protein